MRVLFWKEGECSFRVSSILYTERMKVLDVQKSEVVITVMQGFVKWVGMMTMYYCYYFHH